MDESLKTTQSGSWIKWFIVFALLLVSLAVLLWSLPNSSLKIQARLDALKKAGYPITAQDLDKMYPPLPHAQNSVIIYQKAFSRYVAPPTNATNWPIFSDSNFPFRTETLPLEVRQGISDYVNQNENTLALLHQAASVEKGYYDIGLSNGFANSARVPFVQIRTSADLLALATILRAEDRQSGAATALILDSLGLPSSLEHDPRLASQMIRDGILALSCTSLESTLNKSALTEEQLRSLAGAFQEAEPSDGLKRSLIYERCEGIYVHELLETSPFSPHFGSLKGRLDALVDRTLHYRAGDFIFYLDTMQGYIAASDIQYPKRLELVKELMSKVKESRESKGAFGFLLVQSWDKAFQIDAKARAQLLLSETALAIERYRLAHQDQLPATLQDLVPVNLPAVPTDPFDGKPLRYNRLPKGYLLYSIGEDGVDNGGTQWDAEKKTGDLTFTVER